MPRRRVGGRQHQNRRMCELGDCGIIRHMHGRQLEGLASALGRILRQHGMRSVRALLPYRRRDRGDIDIRI